MNSDPDPEIDPRRRNPDESKRGLHSRRRPSPPSTRVLYPTAGRWLTARVAFLLLLLLLLLLLVLLLLPHAQSRRRRCACPWWTWGTGRWTWSAAC
jgi:hypothetical protein